MVTTVMKIIIHTDNNDDFGPKVTGICRMTVKMMVVVITVYFSVTGRGYRRC